MKNIHVLPTDKPSRLFEIIQFNLSFDKTNYFSEEYKKLHKYKNKNIYITSDEEIKEGDLGTDGTLLGYYGFDEDGCPILKNTKNNKVYEFGLAPYAKKIILTTDQDLIKDGVQTIDDEFLEWFVKNPSCEEVEIEESYSMSQLSYSGIEYEIIIPKEEPKQQCKDCNDNLTDCTCIEDTVDMKQWPESTGDIFSDYAVGESKAIQNSMHLDAEIACRSMYRPETTADYIDRHIVEAMVEVAKQNLYSKEEVKHLMTLAFEQGFKKASIVEAGLEGKETSTEVNWIFLKHKK